MVFFFGAFVGLLASQGKSDRLVCNWAVFLLLGGLAARLKSRRLTSEQPYGVWYGLLPPAVVAAVLLTWVWTLLRRAYREAEDRKMEAVDLNP